MKNNNIIFIKQIKQIKTEIELIKISLNEKINKLEKMIDDMDDNKLLTCDICNIQQFNVSQVPCCGKNSQWFQKESIIKIYNCCTIIYFK